MFTKKQILGDPEIAGFLKTNVGVSKAVIRAAEKLEGNSDAIPALKKVLPALSQKKVEVFFSYRKKDEEAAATIVQILREPAGNLNITYMVEFKEEIAGKKYREHIHSKVQKANWFILLLPDPSEGWQWPLFETGIFEGQLTCADRLICLHHPDIILPDPIKDYEDVPAIQSEVEKFLHMAYVKEDPVPGMEAINPNIKHLIPYMAQRIVNAIVPPQMGLFRDTFEPWLELRIPNAEKMMTKEELDAALIVSATTKALNLFNFKVRPNTFGSLRSELPKPGDDRWRDELFHVIRRTARGLMFYPIQSIFQTQDGKMYRPILCAVDRKKEEGPIETYHVTFTEEVGHVNGTAIPTNIADLATILRFAFRFKWEVLQRFGNRTLTENDLVQLKNTMQRIRIEWQSRANVKADWPTRLFEPHEANRITEMLQYWNSKNNIKGTGEIDVAIEKKDAPKVSALLNEFIPFSQEFVDIATGHFCTVSNETSPEKSI